MISFNFWKIRDFEISQFFHIYLYHLIVIYLIYAFILFMLVTVTIVLKLLFGRDINRKETFL